MKKTEYHVIGVMSGTSLDGIDLINLTFYFRDKVWSFKIHHAETVGYEKKWYNTLKDLVDCSLEELQIIDKAYTRYLAEVINRFVNENRIKNLDVVCSHGHTALHQPEQKTTYQIGNMPEIAKLLNNKVVCDFRVQDVAYGGQGAPLVPIGDRLLFGEYNYCINLGGFANLSYEYENKRIAFDICPANIVLNYYVKELELPYDDEGKIAASGIINTQLLEALNNLDFYKEAPPKSLGLEWVKSYILPLIDGFNLEVKDVLKTFVEHISIQIVNVLGAHKNKSVLITGGGAYHKYLISRLRKLSGNTIIIPTKTIVEYKEALIFGFLGVLKLREETNCLQSVTGAKKNHSTGKIYLQ